MPRNRRHGPQIQPPNDIPFGMVRAEQWAHLEPPHTSIINLIATLQEVQRNLPFDMVQCRLDRIEQGDGAYSFCFSYFRPETPEERELRVMLEEQQVQRQRWQRREQLLDFLANMEAGELDEILNAPPPREEEEAEAQQDARPHRIPLQPLNIGAGRIVAVDEWGQ